MPSSASRSSTLRFRPDVAGTFAATLGRFILGFAMQQIREPHESHAEVAARFEATDAVRYPALHTTARFMPVPLRTEFLFALRLLVSGLSDLRGPAAVIDGA